MSSDTRGVVFTGYFQNPQITTMAGYIFSVGKDLVVVNIPFGFLEHTLNHIA